MIFVFREIRKWFIIKYIMIMRPQDLVVSLLHALHPERRWDFTSLAKSSALSLSEAHSSVKRATRSGLLAPSPSRTGTVIAVREALLEFLIHGARYVYPAQRSGVGRGLPTAHSFPPFAELFVESEDLPLVWPWPTGSFRGESLAPIYKTVPRAALEDDDLYRALALLDAVRAGNTRERALASTALGELLLDESR